jgi:hypothetical protein
MEQYPSVSIIRCTWVDSEMSNIIKAPPEYGYTQQLEGYYQFDKL